MYFVFKIGRWKFSKWEVRSIEHKLCITEDAPVSAHFIRCCPLGIGFPSIYKYTFDKIYTWINSKQLPHPCPMSDTNCVYYFSTMYRHNSSILVCWCTWSLVTCSSSSQWAGRLGWPATLCVLQHQLHLVGPMWHSCIDALGTHGSSSQWAGRLG